MRLAKPNYNCEISLHHKEQRYAFSACKADNFETIRIFKTHFKTIANSFNPDILLSQAIQLNMLQRINF